MPPNMTSADPESFVRTGRCLPGLQDPSVSDVPVGSLLLSLLDHIFTESKEREDTR